jgi:hypothetical protein
MKTIKCFIVSILVLSMFLSACQQAAEPTTAQGEQAVEQPAEGPTDALAPTDTLVPTDTEVPPPTETPTPVPTDTPTEVPTETPLPTDTPTITPTPGPFSFIDDFTENSGGWVDCELCAWEYGMLKMGPFPPDANFHKNYCTDCGEYTYYTIAVDGTFLEGQVDRFFGVFVGDANGEQYYLGISPWQYYVVGKHYDENDSWDVLDLKWSGAVVPSYGTNHFEVAVKPAKQPDTADIFFTLNGSTIYIVYGVPVGPSKVGLAMDWHAVTANYDNWSFVEIEK